MVSTDLNFRQSQTTKGGRKRKTDVMNLGLSKRGVWAPDLWTLDSSSRENQVLNHRISGDSNIQHQASKGGLVSLPAGCSRYGVTANLLLGCLRGKDVKMEKVFLVMIW